MSRWHKSSCHSPKVFVEDGLPRCESCGRSPNIQKLVSEQANLSTPWTVPPDENFGEMNLCWLESVQYSPQPAGTDFEETKKAGDMGRRDELSPIYHKRLQEGHFRLLYLPSVDDKNSPIHASFEAYQTDDCPEYETVSYCWGGENDDATLCKPVFLGDYWDILLQTQNCWSMLQYLRPRVGVRTIWVDAICINQVDHQERESQVAVMGSIYQRCLRAVVYLGQDVVHPKSTDNRAYPGRRDLDTESASAVDLPQLLKMRYFQRVWVIQELILAPMVIIPVHGVELTARRHPALREEVTWHESDAPWMRHLCAVQSDTSLRKTLEQTRNSQSADPRDKVFGLLGFLPQVPTGKGLRPNYLLSSRHIYIGTVAYLLLNEGHSHILTQAAGHKASPTIPSWLPDGNLLNIGELLRDISDSSPELVSQGCYESQSSVSSTFWTQILRLNPDWEVLLLAKSRERQDHGALETPLPSSRKPSIHPSTSALSLPLLYICESFSRPVHILQNRPVGQLFMMTVAHCTLYICTSDASLKSAIEPGLTNVFLLKDRRNSPLLLFLRRHHSDADFRLLKCCPCFGLYLSRKPPSESNFPPSVHHDIPTFPTFNNPRFRLTPLSQDSTPILKEKVYGVVSEVGSLCNKSWEALQWMGPRANSFSRDSIKIHITGLFYQLFSTPQKPFVDLYVNFLRHCSPECYAEIRQGRAEAWVHVSMDPNNWLRIQQSLNGSWYEKVFIASRSSSTTQYVGPWYWADTPDCLSYEDLDISDTGAESGIF
ncbi:uncharacterized protein NECHADRAFT_82416 [Fusarium vanettenii 77-13-4]|uniref:Heterokaryon incompatibility domain-containing protein n=1 Tax=Fusarium vanettenii (strain ATCC MYA-4622 / CBS 123669 / FGSC 9596 / NRRL 45880 / 77-13-4) TaxID=660122 RepID=C7ZML3_FUSV7|nr:uncharacterized protein NECHADRAFT_82416 [Fusarium vanettenii 77-13-4]EEU34792.1 hypothetical protein NECHADRAFT_82416 [Fusarium vanettenii 77-13-4]